MRKASDVGNFQRKALRKLPAHGQIYRVGVGCLDRVVEPPIDCQSPLLIRRREREAPWRRGRKQRVRCREFVQSGYSRSRRDRGGNGVGLLGRESERTELIKRAQQPGPDAVEDDAEAAANRGLAGAKQGTGESRGSAWRIGKRNSRSEVFVVPLVKTRAPVGRTGKVHHDKGI